MFEIYYKNKNKTKKPTQTPPHNSNNNNKKPHENIGPNLDFRFSLHLTGITSIISACLFNC